MPQADRKYPATFALFLTLSGVESYAGLLAMELERIHERLERLAPPGDFRYVPLPDVDASMKARNRATEERERLQRPVVIEVDGEARELTNPHQAYWFWFDSYHRVHSAFRRTLQKAKLAAAAAALELDPEGASPLDVPSNQIRLELQNLGGAVPHPQTDGSWPPTGQGVEEAIRQRLQNIVDWTDKLRALTVPEGAAPAAPTGSGASSTPGERPEQSEVGSEEGATPARHVEAASRGLVGWAEICEALGVQNDRPTQRRLKRQNDRDGGPIAWPGGRKPEVREYDLLKWFGDVQHRAGRAEQERSSGEGAQAELGERDGARQRDYGMNTKRRKRR